MFLPALAATLSLLPLSLGAHAQRVATYLEGTLDSSRQSLEDRDYLDVTVRHCRVSLEEGADREKDAIHMYVEQAVSVRQGAPYRQRFMKIGTDSLQGTVTSTIYENDVAKSFVGLCDRPLAERRVPAAGFESGKCTVSLRPEGAGYVGSTPEGYCPSTYRGAVGVSSKVSLGDGYMDSWDQGWGADGTQVWGAVKGPYRFLKVAPEAPRDPESVALAGMLTGFASNAAQVAAAPADYVPVSNDICAVRLSPGADVAAGSLTLYVEQNVSAGSRTLLRQRAYEIDRDTNGGLRLLSHGIAKDAGASLVGLCRSPEATRFAPAGVAIAFTRDDMCPLSFKFDSAQGGFVGRTPVGGCASDFQGAVRLEIEELLTDDAYRVWERWFDASGQQVAGSAVGPYEYVRK